MIKANVEIKNKSWHKKIKDPKKYISEKLKKILKFSNFSRKKNLIFTVLLTNSNYIKKLNKKFRKKNKSTDVLSFPFFLKKDLSLVRDKNIYIGDIAISYEIINSRSKKNNFFIEFDKVWIHGFLHLLGYDHIKDRDYFKMKKIENFFLNLTN